MAQTIILKTSRNVRSGPDFYSTSNQLGQISKGSVVKVVEAIKLESGKNAYRVEIISFVGNVKMSEVKWIFNLNQSEYEVVSSSSATLSTTDSSALNVPTRLVKNISLEGQLSSNCIGCSTATAAGKNNQKDLNTLEKLMAPYVPRRLQEIPFGKIVETYSNSDEVKRMIKFSEKKYGQVLRGPGKCYTGVKAALAAAGLVPHKKIGGEAALSAKETLKEFNFINLMEEPHKLSITNPSQAPLGAILVYSSGKKCRNSKIKDCGHIEIRTDKGFISDFFSTEPITTDPRYKLVAVMVKKMDGTK